MAEAESGNAVLHGAYRSKYNLYLVSFLICAVTFLFFFINVANYTLPCVCTITSSLLWENPKLCLQPVSFVVLRHVGEQVGDFIQQSNHRCRSHSEQKSQHHASEAMIS